MVLDDVVDNKTTNNVKSTGANCNCKEQEKVKVNSKNVDKVKMMKI